MMGKVIMSGIVPQMKVPISGILASDLAVGSSVYLMENGVATEYLVVNHGIPEQSSLYDASCDGLWLLRKDIKESRQWHSSDVNNYKNSTIHAWLNEDFFNQFGAVEQTAIKHVKIPYVNGTGGSSVASGTNGLSAKVFLLSGYEVGFDTSVNTNFPLDGAKLDYFELGDTSLGPDRPKRKAYMNGSSVRWWLRSANKGEKDKPFCVDTDGSSVYFYASVSSPGIRPALVLPSNALFDKTTLILKGVA